MIYLQLFIFSIFVVFSTSTIDCSQENSCFGEPANCDPDSDCQTLFHFDQHGNLDLYLRKFNNPFGYAAFAIDSHPDQTIEYFICLPYEKQRLRGYAELGEAILVTEQTMQGVVEKIGKESFKCHFKVTEYPKKFHEEQHFFVTRGTFDEAVIIVDGSQLFNLELDDSEDDDEFMDDEDTGSPTVHHIGIPMRRNAPVKAFSARDSLLASRLIRKVRKISKGMDENVEDVPQYRAVNDYDKEPSFIPGRHPKWVPRFPNIDDHDSDEMDMNYDLKTKGNVKKIQDDEDEYYVSQADDSESSQEDYYNEVDSSVSPNNLLLVIAVLIVQNL